MSYIPVRPDPSLPPVTVNLYSDTQTRPTPAMLDAMKSAETGDEQHGDDPTVWALCDRMAALLGKEAAVFLPSGTMCNVVALLVHCRPGDEVLAHRLAHIITSEHGNHAALGGIMMNPLDGERGLFDVAAVEAALRPRSRYAPPQKLLEVEQTANLGGGVVWPQAQLDAVLARGHEAGLATHMDGARLMNAVVAAGIPAAEMVAGCDSVWVDFTKGLGAPLGAVLAGSTEFISEAWRWKQRLGGSMRQGGVSAAACLYALDHNIDRLAGDHTNARTLARGLAQLEGMKVEQPDTNLVFFDPRGAGLTAEAFATAMRQQGVMVSTLAGRVRACTHLDVSAAQIELALTAARAVVAAA
ncbi:L-threonine aldolase [Humitalea rosea]|uniref:L-threonine aldolase n=1 Tax=Humitalea rosea TaxID=990373 RepID=A0A2W7IK42_9PROT|nr:threonine aldolase family protein [Humitalea rosea]PZW45597.1 L-threonine aldolase [Humitalea rosea]